MNTKSIALVACLSVTFSIKAQHYFYNEKYYDSDWLYELAISAGAMNCFTDIGGRKGNGGIFLKDLNLSNTLPTGGISVGFLYRLAMGLRVELNLGSVKASDDILKNDVSVARNRYLRNLHFKSPITEFVLLGEIHPVPILFPAVEGAKTPALSPYITGGIGFFGFDPQANLNGEWVRLQPLSTEGQGFAAYADRKPYKLTALNFPVGIGLRYEMAARFALKLELLHRITRTDYLDDVSTTYIDPAFFYQYHEPGTATLAHALHDRQQEINPAHITRPGAIRGNGGKNDSYFTAVLKIALVLGREKR